MEEHLEDRDVLTSPYDDSWTVVFGFAPEQRPIVESLTAIGNGSFGTRGLVSWRDAPELGSSMAGGIYDNDDVPALLQGPRWTKIRIDGTEVVRETAYLDMRRGVLHGQIETRRGSVATTQIASCARIGVHVLLVEGPTCLLEAKPILEMPPDRSQMTSATEADDRTSTVTMIVTSSRGQIATSAHQTEVDHGTTRLVTRLVATSARYSDRGADDAVNSTRPLLDSVRSLGLARIIAEHETVWEQRWATAAIDIPAVPNLERCLRFAQFHLMSSSNDGHEVAIGARGLTGRAYRGHVFWDTDVFVVPALAGMAPPLARAAIRYRWHRLDAARRRAASEGRQGTRFPWESADTGVEATPRHGVDLQGDTVPIRTGLNEEHIVADVAWSAANYLNWTNDRQFEREVASEIITETARYWQSRVEIDDDGSAHIRGVIGPDEYHEDVDDNTFTNMMARWNLAQAAELDERLGLGLERERSAWRHTSERLEDGYDADRGLHEQFDGFFALEPLLATSVRTPPFPADALLGWARVQQAQLIKQPDVLMLHHLISEDLPEGSLTADLDFYLPRTTHGSSLSPAITASVLARDGRLDEALHWFEMAARFDLDDISGTTAGGLHLGTMGGLWQAFTQGFLGVRPTRTGLIVDPRVPSQWGSVTHRFVAGSQPVRLVVSTDRFALISPTPVTIEVPGAGQRTGNKIEARSTDYGWEFS